MFDLKNKICLAPMAGATDYAFRQLAKDYDCDMTVTEMISVKALSYNDKKSLSMMQAHDEKGLKGLQIFGSDAGLFKEVTKAHLNDAPYDFIDINMGCPAPKIVKNGEGSALMTQPELAMRLVDAVKSVSNKPVSVKIRLGFEENVALSFAKAMEKAGADFITIHGRTREQMYSGEADWQTIVEVASVLSIPVIGNGDISTPEQAIERLETPVTAIMIGRGAQGKPWLFRQIKRLLEGERLSEPNLKMRIDIINKHMQLMLTIKPEHVVINEMRKHVAWYLKGLYGANHFKTAINRATSIEEIEKNLQNMLDNAELD